MERISPNVGLDRESSSLPNGKSCEEGETWRFLV